MGSCQGCKQTQYSKENPYIIGPIKTSPASRKFYPQTVHVTVNQPTSIGVSVQTQVLITATQPVYHQAEAQKTNSYIYHISSCVLQNQDPIRKTEKPCQDRFVVCRDDDHMLLAVFDGHGEFGHTLSEKCVKATQKYFQTRSIFGVNPKEYVSTLIIRCEETVTRKLPTFCETAGTTALAALVFDGRIYVASVGDSRAVALVSTEKQEQVSSALGTKDKTLSRHLEFNQSGQSLAAIQLSKDHTPEDPVEYSRLKHYGAVIEQNQMLGVKRGPLRIWRPDLRGPGLAMSRSIGDRIAKQIGVIAKPSVSELGIDQNDTKFLVLASDGVWEVMANQQVADFVQAHSQQARRSVPHSNERPEELEPIQTTIAHLLAEEARMHRIPMVIQREAHIDDITCVVLEIRDKNDAQFERVCIEAINTGSNLAQIVGEGSLHQELTLQEID